ncbi:hypothetical protein Sviol_60750 [Streptomyces violascens]|uniref:Uncharacterized protein n=1 Tax=Streptomyces violascens TaxID=67381 RepID=A0ABQ3QWL0_9ACTN|nr:hypothetical protein Sviol_60750 [Streptomyces violascens]
MAAAVIRVQLARPRPVAGGRVDVALLRVPQTSRQVSTVGGGGDGLGAGGAESLVAGPVRLDAQSRVAPTYTFNAAKFPQAAAHAWLLQEKLATHPGRAANDKPLYYLTGERSDKGKNRHHLRRDELGQHQRRPSRDGDGRGQTELRRVRVQRHIQQRRSARKNEYGLNPVASGKECVQTFAKKLDDGVHLLNVPGQAPNWSEVCGRSAISGKHNQGSMGGFSGFAKNMRLQAKDGY